ncbi:MAG TPA: RNA polymerase sigma factor [Firmicutes bacterium]|nr:RNA polymerase sigma factor [Bacillota bacterium]
MDTAVLMEKMKKGDMSALGELAEVYQQPLYYYIVRMVRDRDTAEDLTQEVFLKVWRYRKNYSESGKLNAWIYRIAHNLVRNYVKKRNRNTELPEHLAHFDEVQEDIEYEEKLSAVREALETLPELFKEAVVYRDVEGRSYQDIAALLDISEGTVKSRISRGREMIRETIKKEWGELYDM